MIKNIFSKTDIERLGQVIDGNKMFVLTCHAGPDGDALGSTLGMAHYLQALGKEAVVIVPDAYPDFLAWMPGSQEIVRFDKYGEKAGLMIAMADVIMAMDYNALSRVDDMGALIEKAKAVKVLVDHHLHPDAFCDISFSYPQLSSTCEVVFRLVVAMGGYDRLTKQACECLYAGVMTDTGNFSYGPCTQELYLIVSMLMQKEINKDRIYNKVFNNYSEGRLRLMGYVLYEKMRVFPEEHAALITLSREEMKRFDFNKGDTEGLVNIPLQMKGIYFSAFLREDTEKDVIRVSLRSQGTFPCNKFAAKYFNGGGHLNASGGQYDGTLQGAIGVFEEALKEFPRP
ncbi:MAG: DHH family phosphoesterase [Bacteroidaceae bacterium]|nr:DHH family phosphoesterase [Bacteroidaceae bacterium]